MVSFLPHLKRRLKSFDKRFFTAVAAESFLKTLKYFLPALHKYNQDKLCVEEGKKVGFADVTVPDVTTIIYTKRHCDVTAQKQFHDTVAKYHKWQTLKGRHR